MNKQYSSTDVFRVRDGVLDDYLMQEAIGRGFDVGRGLERSGFVPTLRTLVGSQTSEYTSHPNDMTTQIGWFVYEFVTPRDGFHRPDGFLPRSIIAEPVDSPYMSNSVRISLWSARAPFKVVSDNPVSVESFKHRDGIPKSYEAARWTLDNVLEIVLKAANKLIPYARAVAEEARRQGVEPL